jgi:predicted peptidase
LFVLSGVSETQITTFGDEELAEQGKVLETPVSFLFEGAEKGGEVHGWLFKPKGLKGAKERGEDRIRKYPVILWIHGGPQSCWADEWDNQCALFISLSILGSRKLKISFGNSGEISEVTTGRSYT